jgi:two-component system, OmpR family, KDP operon response regulator KdpE
VAPALPHVLIAEDNELVCTAMRILFEETGHRVTTSGSVAEIVDAGARDPIDLLLLDLGLADGDGFDVLAGLRNRDAMPRVTVALTGRHEPDIATRLKEAGCVAVLLKPVPARELLTMTGEWLGETNHPEDKP